MDSDPQGWLEIDAATGKIKTKGKLDRETLETFEVTVTVFEKENPEMSAERVLSVRLLDVNDHYPKLTETQAFICMLKPKPIIIKAQDPDSFPNSEPFKFDMSAGKKYQNWKLVAINDTSAKLTLIKKATEETNSTLSITVKDSAGMGVPQLFVVRICNCTELGYCYIPHRGHFSMGVGPTFGILVGTLGFCTIVFIVVIRRTKKGQKTAVPDEGERNPLSQ